MSLVTDVVVVAADGAVGLRDVLVGLARQEVRRTYVVDRPDGQSGLIAGELGATVLTEPRSGYGAACRRGATHVIATDAPPEVLVFMSGGGADDPAELDLLVRPIGEEGCDLVIGSRTLGDDEAPWALRDRVSRGLAIGLIRALYGQRYSDLGGFRAVRVPALVSLKMSNDGPGFNVEMQVKAVKTGLRVSEVPVHSHRAPGREKPSLVDSAIASSKILYTIFRHSTTR